MQGEDEEELFFANPAIKAKKAAEFQRVKESLPKDFPKVSTAFDGIKYNHSTKVFGLSLGMEEKQAIIMAEKFRKAENQARQENPSQSISRTIELVAPTLTPEELAFCIGLVVIEKSQIQQSDNPLSKLLGLL